ncbi:MAG: hypothetical protein AB8G77_24635, partial [Rhodothermales bacterium]
TRKARMIGWLFDDFLSCHIGIPKTKVLRTSIFWSNHGQNGVCSGWVQNDTLSQFRIRICNPFAKT